MHYVICVKCDDVIDMNDVATLASKTDGRWSHTARLAYGVTFPPRKLQKFFMIEEKNMLPCRCTPKCWQDRSTLPKGTVSAHESSLASRQSFRLANGLQSFNNPIIVVYSNAQPNIKLRIRKLVFTGNLPPTRRKKYGNN